MVLGFCASEEDAVCADAKKVKDRTATRSAKADFFMNQHPAERNSPTYTVLESPDCKSLHGGGILGAGQNIPIANPCVYTSTRDFCPKCSLSAFLKRFVCYPYGRLCPNPCKVLPI